MGSLFRSAPMSMCKLIVPSDCAYQSLAQLGELGIAQFIDMTPNTNAFQRKFVNDVRRCDEMERKIRSFCKEIFAEKFTIIEDKNPIPAPNAKELTDLDRVLETLETDIKEIKDNEERMRTSYSEIKQMKSAINVMNMTMGDPPPDIPTDVMETQEISRQQDTPALKFIVGMIKQEKFAAFERIIWRSCRGNVLIRSYIVAEGQPDPFDADNSTKTIFVAFYQGEYLGQKVKKICDGFRATTYENLSPSREERDNVQKQLEERTNELTIVLNKTIEHKRQILHATAAMISKWTTKVRKAKAIFHTLNLLNLDISQKNMIGDIWVPKDSVSVIRAELGKEAESGHNTGILLELNTAEMPPTFFRTNKFTSGFQGIVDAYGIATYQEVNPACFTIISFPFLFAIMFGDFGHGMVMFFFALILVLKEKPIITAKIKDEIFSTFFHGRYIILLMGIFAMYTGIMYNEVFSRAFNVFGSSWLSNYYEKEVAVELAVPLYPDTPAWRGYPYPFGMDPVWQFAENRLLFTNSYKMKMSVIFGIFQMMFGVVLGAFNHIHFKDRNSLIGEFVPMMLFLSCIFFYLCVMIFYKWTTYGAVGFGNYPGSNCAPSLLIGLIDMVMFKSRTPLTSKGGPDCALMSHYAGQDMLEHILLIIAALSVPWMLLYKPIAHLIAEKKKAKNIVAPAHSLERLNVNDQEIELASTHSGTNGATKDQSAPEHAHPPHEHDHDEPHSMGDVFIHQAIHTIEFSLGCISHTASYLRLWALSLAHSELTIVLWEMILRMAFSIMPATSYVGCVLVFVLFAAFACLTVAILVVMEGLSAFLHALRLHWVEFNSKFYKGEGYQFTPFSFEAILAEEFVIEEARTSTSAN